jgi:hypothetical protein
MQVGNVHSREDLLPAESLRTTQAGIEIEVFENAQVVLQPKSVGKPSEFGAELLVVAKRRLPPPANLATVWRQETGDHAQQAGLSTAIRADDQQQLTGFQRESDIFEQATLAAKYAELLRR